MKKNMTFKALLFAGALILAAGCGKDIFSQKFSRNVGEEVVFGVKSSSEIGTRTEYRNVTEYPTQSGKKIQPIDWIQGDILRIYSPDCHRASWDKPEQWADYKIKSVDNTATNGISKGTLENVAEVGLAWEDNGNHKFYAIFPSPGTDEANEPNGTQGKFSFTIPAAQTEAAQMQYAFMTAAASADGGVTGDAVNLDFYPAFTAFTLDITAEEPTIFEDFEMESTSVNLAGTCTVTYNGLTPAYACTSTTKKITVDLQDKVLAENGNFKMIIFAAPTDLKDLTIRFTVSTPNSTNPSRTNSLELKYSDTHSDASLRGKTVTFAGTKMHVLKGLVTPRSTKIIEVNSQIVDWVSKGEATIDVIPQ